MTMTNKALLKYLDEPATMGGSVKHFYLPSWQRKALLALALLSVLVLISLRFEAIDIAVADYYFDAQRHVFPWKNSWFAKAFMHGYIKDGLQLAGVLLCAAVLIDLVKPWLNAPLLRIRLRFIALSAVLISSITTLLKQRSVLHCPWDIDRYGGAFHHLSLFDAIPAHYAAGHCFPAGHATSGLWLAACCVFWLPHQPKTAWRVFLAGLSVGIALGWVQQMRGAHFLSHTLTTVWIACCILLCLFMFTPSLSPSSLFTPPLKEK